MALARFEGWKSDRARNFSMVIVAVESTQIDVRSILGKKTDAVWPWLEIGLASVRSAAACGTKVVKSHSGH
jgi:hypothetical protein